jgi:hypothetical protein
LKSAWLEAAASAVSTPILLARTRSSRCWSKVCIDSPRVMYSTSSLVLAASLMHSRMLRVVRITSTAGTRPVCFLVGRSRSETIAWRFSASRARTWMCSSGGKNDTSRLMVDDTSLVWIDE